MVRARVERNPSHDHDSEESNGDLDVTVVVVRRILILGNTSKVEAVRYLDRFLLDYEGRRDIKITPSIQDRVIV